MSNMPGTIEDLLKGPTYAKNKIALDGLKMEECLGIGSGFFVETTTGSDLVLKIKIAKAGVANETVEFKKKFYPSEILSSDFKNSLDTLVVEAFLFKTICIKKVVKLVVEWFIFQEGKLFLKMIDEDKIEFNLVAGKYKLSETRSIKDFGGIFSKI